MKHLGDITTIDWSKVEPVDVVTGGSPCQDLSVAGKRAGLAGERSGLYMEQIKCVKELRKADVLRGRTGELIRPRYMVWENVPGAFSSGKPKGADFAAVIEEIIKVAEPDAYVCVVPPSDRWTKSGCYYDRDGKWSIAWRVHDAQFWGVPQRRKRISLVADFGGLSAPEILFERKGLRGDFAEGRTPWQSTSPDAERGSGADDCEGAVPYTLKIRSGCEGGGKGALVQEDKSATLATNNDQYLFQPIGLIDSIGGQAERGREGDIAPCLKATHYKFAPVVAVDAAGFCPEQSAKTRGIGWEEEKAPTLRAGVTPAVVCKTYDTRGNGDGWKEDVGYPLNTIDRPAVVYAIDQQGGKGGANYAEDVMPTICSDSHGTPHAVAYGIGNGQANQSFSEEQAGALNCMHDQQAVAYAEVFRQGGFADYVEGEVETLRAAGGDYGGGTENLLVERPAVRYIVRRLTPLECERLQGFPDNWTDIGDWVDSKGKKHKAADSPRYKALGNSIALPFWCWLAKRISAQYERDITMGSLFDGIGGFPYAFEKCGGKALWASEIEEFPIAVTKMRFPEEEA